MFSLRWINFALLVLVSASTCLIAQDDSVSQKIIDAEFRLSGIWKTDLESTQTYMRDVLKIDDQVISDRKMWDIQSTQGFAFSGNKVATINFASDENSQKIDYRDEIVVTADAEEGFYLTIIRIERAAGETVRILFHNDDLVIMPLSHALDAEFTLVFKRIGDAPEVVKDNAPEGLVPVEGTISIDGKPLAGAVVTIVNAEGVGTAMTDETGAFKVMTIRGPRGYRGALPGTYQVAIKKTEPVEDIGEEPDPSDKAAHDAWSKKYVAIMKAFISPKDLIPAEFGDPKTSGLIIEIPEKGKQDISIKLQTE
jgi:hypothetical protein